LSPRASQVSPPSRSLKTPPWTREYFPVCPVGRVSAEKKRMRPLLAGLDVPASLVAEFSADRGQSFVPRLAGAVRKRCGFSVARWLLAVDRPRSVSGAPLHQRFQGGPRAGTPSNWILDPGARREPCPWTAAAGPVMGSARASCWTVISLPVPRGQRITRCCRSLKSACQRRARPTLRPAGLYRNPGTEPAR